MKSLLLSKRTQLLHSHQTDLCLKHVSLSLYIIRHHAMKTHDRMESGEIVSQPRHPLAVFISVLFSYLISLPCGPRPRSFVTFRNIFVSIGQELLAPRSTPKFSAAYDCLVSILACALHIWRQSPASATRAHAMPW